MDALLKTHKAELKALGTQTAASLNGRKGAERAALELEASKQKRELLERHLREERALRERLGTAAEEAAARRGEDEEGEDAAKRAAEEAQKRAEAERKMAKAQEKRTRKEAEEQARQEELEEARARAAGSTPRDVEMEALVREVGKLGLRIQEVAPNGDCLFSAVRVQLEALVDGGEDAEFVDASQVPSVAELRRLAAKAMASNPAMFAPYLPEGETLAAYTARVQLKAEWGGELEVRALGLALRRPVWVHHARGPTVKMCPEFDGAAPPLHLTFHERQFSLGEHYNSAVPEAADVDKDDGFVRA